MWVAATSLVFAASAPAIQAPAPLDRSGEGYLVQLLDRYSKLPPFYLWFDRYSRDSGEGFDKGGTVQLWYGGGKKFRVSSCGAFGDEVLGVSDGHTLLVDSMDLGRPVTLADMPAKWQGLTDQVAPNQGGSLVLWLLDGPGSLDRLAERDKPITLLRRGSAFVVTFTNKALGEMQAEIVDGWLVADQIVQRFDFDGEKFESVSRNEYRPFNFAPRFGRDTFETKVAPGLMVIDERTKPGHKTKPPRS
ncbi:MAG: hypothetical protein KF857_05975 [Fimbriimonadaceae bacterium]|nr:hypothetical protein [Fimbriimonadaceae bacterium]